MVALKSFVREIANYETCGEFSLRFGKSKEPFFLVIPKSLVLSTLRIWSSGSNKFAALDLVRAFLRS